VGHPQNREDAGLKVDATKAEPLENATRRDAKTPGMKILFAAVLMIAVSGSAVGQDEDFHRAKFPEKPEAVYKAAGTAIVHRHPKDHWITLRDDDHLQIHFQTKGTLGNVGYRMTLTVKPDGAGSLVQIDAERIPVKHGLLFGDGKKEIEEVFRDLSAELQSQ
jgi:hypothetical protein